MTIYTRKSASLKVKREASGLFTLHHSGVLGIDEFEALRGLALTHMQEHEGGAFYSDTRASIPRQASFAYSLDRIFSANAPAAAIVVIPAQLPQWQEYALRAASQGVVRRVFVCPARAHQWASHQLAKR